MPEIATIDQLLAYGQAAPGELIAIGMAGESVALQNIDIDLSIDRDAMWARARINNARMDREGDVIEPSGVDWSDYRNNPVVMFDHGFSGIPFPVAQSESPDGLLCVEYDMDEDAIYAKSFFSSNIELSYQTFGLIDEKLLRAVSIHVYPKSGGIARLEGGRHWVHQSNMLEYSWCTLNVNPDAYKKALSADSKISELLALQLERANQILQRGTIGNTTLLPSLAKCLRAMAPPRGHVVRGNSVTEGDMGTKTLSEAEIKKLSPVGLFKALADVATYDAETVKNLRSFAKGMTEETYKAMCDDKAKGMDPLSTQDPLVPAKSDPAEGEMETPEVETESPAMPMGAQYVESLHSNLTSLLDNASSELERVENPAIKDGVTPVIEDLRAKLAELEGLFSSAYPDASPLTSTTPDEQTEVAKSWLANPRSQFQLLGLAHRVSGVINGTVPQAKAKSVLAATVRDLNLLTSQAKSFKPSVPKGYVTQAQFDELQAKYASLEDKSKKLINKLKGEPAPLPT